MGERQIDFVTILDQDLNLYSLYVDEDKKSFEEVCEVKNIRSQLKIDAQWFIFNSKTPFDFETYKKDFKLFSAETMGVVIKD